jgi:Tol biopolymer transport system component
MRKIMTTQVFTKNRLLLALGAIVAMALLLLAPTASKAQYSGTNGRIIGFAGLYGGLSVKPDGTNYFGHNVPFVNTGAINKPYNYSPDGSKIAFSQLDANGTDVHLYTKASSSYAAGGTALTSGTDVRDYNPSFSPDGTKVAFQRRTISTGRDEVYVVGVDGTGLTKLTQNMYTTSSVTHPIWNSTGTILYVCTTDISTTGTGIYSISSTTANQTTATNIIEDTEMTGFGEDSVFDIAPGGSRFIYQSGFSIRSVAFAGTGDVAVVTAVGQDTWYYFGSYSPDGTKISVLRENNVPQTTDLLVMNPDGTSQASIVTGIDSISSNQGPFAYSSYATFWGTSQATYANSGSAGDFQDTGLPNTASTINPARGITLAVLALLGGIALIGLTSLAVKKEISAKPDKQ